MKQFDEAELKVMTQNMYKHGRTLNVLDCLIAMIESELIIVQKLKEILTNEGNY